MLPALFYRQGAKGDESTPGFFSRIGAEISCKLFRSSMVQTLAASTVAVVPIETTVQDAVRKAMELASWQQCIERGKPVCLKVNLGWDLFIPGSVTSPWVIEGVIQTLRDWTDALYIVESDQVLEDIEKAYRKMKLSDLLTRYNVKWINMSQSPSIKVPVPDGKVFHHLELPEILLESQVVTIPVMKTHAKTQITGAIKNQWGCISKLRHNYHLVLTDALADINSVIHPIFAVVDATIALEGNGPKSGKPRIVNRILASSDIVAVDAVQAKMMGFDPSSIAHLQACAQRGLGTASINEIRIAGENDVKNMNLRFQPPRHNLVSKVEELLRRSRLKKLVFDTPLFLLMLFGAKIWYYIWFYLVSGKKHWAEILRDERYAKEWEPMR
jgi:uncharacterized protein (DUF362 family)